MAGIEQIHVVYALLARRGLHHAVILNTSETLGAQ